MRRFVVLAVAAALLSACGDDDSRTGDIEPTPRGLKTCTVSDAQQSTIRKYPSVLQPSSTTTLSFEVSGRLLQVNLDVGQRVSKDEVLASLDPKTLQNQVDNAKAALTQAEVTTKNSKDDYDRKAALLDEGVTTKAQTDQAFTTWKSNEAQEEQARKQLENAQQDLERSELQAPFDGIISSVDMESFTNVTAGTPVATIYADDEFESAFTVSFDVVNRLTVGKQALVRLADDPSIMIPAHVSELGSRADTVSSFPVVVKLDEANPLLKSGMAVEISLEFTVPLGGGYTMPLTVLPMEGVADVPSDPGNPSSFTVFVYDEATGTVVDRPVKVGGIRDNKLIIVDGLSPGDLVACAGVSFLREGMKVTLLPEAEQRAMDFLTRFGISSSRMTVLVMLALLVQGVLIYGSMPKREDPAITIRSALITARFPGMAPERMEDLIVKPIERKLREIGEIEDINSLISTGYTVVTVSIYDSVGSDELDRIFQDIRNKMDDLKEDLPAGTEGPNVNSDYGDVSIATIAVTGEGFSYEDIRQSSDDLREYLYTVEGVSKVSLYGVQEQRVWLEINTRKLAAVGVQLNQVLDDLQAQNVILPAGQIDADGVNIILEANGDLKTIEEIENVLTKVQGLSGYVRLQDLMSVRQGYQDPVNKPVYFDGQPTVVLAVEMNDSEDIQKIGRALETAVKAYEQTRPIGISFNFSTFQETNVTNAINNALLNVLQTFVVVVVVMLIFLGFRTALIIACIVPFTIMFALVGMSMMNIDLQQISIAAVIISLGLLVDNGLVVVEDIQNRIGAGEEPQPAAIASGRQFFVPLAVASITTVSAFIPLLILQGTEGEYAFSLGVVVACMLAGSWITALYILPPLCVWFAKRRAEEKEAEPNRIVRIYGVLVDKSLIFAPFIIVGAYVAVVFAGSLFSQLKSEMFPLSERAEYLIYMDMPKGTAISATEAEALAVDAWLLDPEQNPEVLSTTVYVGDGGPRFYLALSPADTDPASAFFLINTKSFDGAVTAAARAADYLRVNHPSARFKIKRLSMGGGESGIVEVKISGPDAEKLLFLADEVEQAFDSVANMEQNENDWGNKTLKVVIDVSQSKARELGISSKEISDLLDTFYTGTSFSTFREGDQSIPIVVRAEKGFRSSIEDLATLAIPADGRLISLDQVASFDPQLEFSQIRRENQVRLIKISGKSGSLAANQVLSMIRPTLESLDLSGGYTLKIDGETEKSAEVNSKLAAGMPVALMVMLAALMFQFNSARRVLLTFMTVPLIIIGAPLALLLTGLPLSFFAILGMISLAGIIINNAIVLIDQIDIERQTMDMREAVVLAAKKRVTPILLTSLTTIFGLLPMAIGGGALFEPMATLMIGGLAFASVITLFFVPGGYFLLFGGIRLKRKAENVAAIEG